MILSNDDISQILDRVYLFKEIHIREIYMGFL